MVPVNSNWCLSFERPNLEHLTFLTKIETRDTFSFCFFWSEKTSPALGCKTDECERPPVTIGQSAAQYYLLSLLKYSWLTIVTTPLCLQTTYYCLISALPSSPLETKLSGTWFAAHPVKRTGIHSILGPSLTFWTWSSDAANFLCQVAQRIVWSHLNFSGCAEASKVWWLYLKNKKLWLEVPDIADVFNVVRIWAELW